MEKFFFCKKEKRRENTIVKEHSHLCNEIVFYGYNIKGTTKIGKVEAGFSVGDVAIIPSNEPHSEAHLKSGELIFIGFSGGELPPAGVYSDLNELAPLFEVILRESVEQKNFYEKIIACKIDEILTLIKRKITSNVSTVKDILYAKNYITENYSKNINLIELSEMVGYSSDHFRHLFLKKYGISPKNFLIKTRLENAAYLLKSTNKSCTEIAYQCGFSDSSQLTKMFKAKYKISPLGFRKNTRDGNLK